MNTTFCNTPNCAFYNHGCCMATCLRGEIADRIVTTSGGTITGCGAYIHVNTALGFARTLPEMPSDHVCHVYTDADDLPYAICGRVCVYWENLDEGMKGDYDPDDPDDVNLLRFTAYLATEDGWEQVNDASYCTMMPATASVDVLKRAIRSIAKEYGNVLNSDPHQSVKKLGEELSWVSPGDFYFAEN